MCVYVYACSCMYKDAHTYTSAHGNTMILNFPKSDLSSAFLFMLLCVCLCVHMYMYLHAHMCVRVPTEARRECHLLQLNGCCKPPEVEPKLQFS